MTRICTLMVFGPLGFVRRGLMADVDGLSVPLPRPAGLALEQLVTDPVAGRRLVESLLTRLAEP